jgi:hypothetical protein
MSESSGLTVNRLAHFGHFTFLPTGKGLLGFKTALHLGQLTLVAGIEFSRCKGELQFASLTLNL